MDLDDDGDLLAREVEPEAGRMGAGGRNNDTLPEREECKEMEALYQDGHYLDMYPRGTCSV